MKNIKNWIKKQNIILLIAVVAIVIVGYFYFSRSQKPAYDFVTAKRGEVVQEVSVTGRVKPAQAVDLAFEKTGRVANIYVKTGDKVTAQQVLAQLENSDIYFQLLQAQAELKTQQAKLDELKRGSREEEIKVQESKVESAQIAVEEAKKNLIDKIQDAYTKADDAVHNKADQLFKTPVLPTPQINFTLSDAQLEIDLEWERFIIEDMLKLWKTSLMELTVDSDVNAYSKTATSNLNKIKSFLDKANLAVNSLTANATLSQATIDSWRANVSTARTTINTALTNLTAAEEKLKTAEADLNLYNQELVLKKAGATNEEIKAQEAQVEKARANVLNYEAQLNKTILRSPIDGIVAKQDAKIGEIVGANVNIISIISTAKFEIEANVAEADIAKIKVGNPAKVTLDAYGEDVVFEAKVVKIEPAETMIEGVATYKTTLQFIKEDERIKSGMTANIDILTDKRENAIVIPRRAVIGKNGDKVVRILNGKNVSEVKVKTGLIGSDGNIEIIEGINEGDKIIISEK